MGQLQKDMERKAWIVIANELHAQTKQTFDKIVESDWRLTQHNFLVNSGGPGAVLAYLGTSASSKFAV